MYETEAPRDPYSHRRFYTLDCFAYDFAFRVARYLEINEIHRSAFRFVREFLRYGRIARGAVASENGTGGARSVAPLLERCSIERRPRSRNVARTSLAFAFALVTFQRFSRYSVTRNVYDLPLAGVHLHARRGARSDVPDNDERDVNGGCVLVKAAHCHAESDAALNRIQNFVAVERSSAGWLPNRNTG